MTRVLVCAFVVALLAGQVYADLDLRINEPTGSSTVNYDGATFTVNFAQSTGTGVYDPFLRIQANTMEAGFNTDMKPQPPLDTKAGTWTHSIRLGEIPQVDGRYQFRLDINQSNNPFLSLDVLQIYLGGNGSPTSLAQVQGFTKVYDLDTGSNGDERILLDYGINSGSGSGDMEALIPIVGNPGQYLTLYSVFGYSGGVFESNDGFEEWGTLGTVPVPVPGAVLLGFLGLGAAGWRLRRFA